MDFHIDTGSGKATVEELERICSLLPRIDREGLDEVFSWITGESRFIDPNMPAYEMIPHLTGFHLEG